MGVLDGLPARHRDWLDELDPATLELFASFDDTLLTPGHDAHHLRVDLRLVDQHSTGWGEPEWRAMALWAHLIRHTANGVTGNETDLRLAQRKLKWTPDQRDLLWRAVVALPDKPLTDYRYRVPIAAIKDLTPTELGPLLPLLLQARKDMAGVVYPADSTARRVLHDLLAAQLAEDPVEAAHAAVPAVDPFAALLREEYGARLGAAGSLPLLRHWITATTATPPKGWTDRARELLTPESTALLREVLGRVPGYREQTWHNGYRDVVTYLDKRTADLLRGMLWTCEVVDEPWAVGLLGEVALATGTGIGGSGPNARNERVANAALNVLDRIGGLDVVAPLARVQAKVRRKSILTKVAGILESIGAREGLTPDQLLERTVPAFGLGPDGTRTRDGLTLSVTGAITFEGRKTVPKSVDRALLAEFRATAKELKKALPAERFRVERALAAGRTWSWHDVRALYLDHPVTGFFARTLIWEIVQGPAGLPVQVGGAWELTGPAGDRIQPGPETEVRLWHPLGHTPDEVRVWRDHLLDRGLRQPFKQAFREIYPLTPAEEGARDHSRRFAGHLLRYGQAKALITERGWSGLSLGWWDGAGGSDRCTATRRLPGGLTAAWDFHLGPYDDDHLASICVSGDLRFYDGLYREYDNPATLVPLTEVPRLDLSEALRDADLAVGVTSTGLDPEGEGDYWRSYGFGDLAESAKVRRDALARLLPRLAIADRCALTDRFLVVRGDLRTYKIHLGSGNILMEPDDAYLCIVPTGAGDRVFLPFEEEGGMLSVVLSKAFLLADDTAITDPTITHQLRT
ncbi:DUF4132 domain-containing protein [Herbidospora cretacea]|uniref:DUF4132 domain-containing protein n=1 Tax=Herbidospora cretacea TaxID=28444 RepID=UPI00077436FF|nr:DUF4132 domain-containing protein [Herbidospora cretacea]